MKFNSESGFARIILTSGMVISTLSVFAEVPAESSWSRCPALQVYDRAVVFDTDAIGKKLPVLWGFDTAWNDYANMLRGVRYTGSDIIGVARVSFQPWAEVTGKGVLPMMLQENLDKRMETVALIGKKVDIALNLDGGEPTLKNIYGGLDANNRWQGNVETAAEAYARLIDATAAAVQEKGYRVVSAAPFNEPDYFWNGTPLEVFKEICSRLKDASSYPRFAGIRLSGGNTLNCDEALGWYEELKENLDEGCTHQLAGDFNHYADFFSRVRADGKYATADELHNVMEAMVGAEYGMQTGIWWGTAERARAEFCKASFGERIGYAENRKAWSAASVYRAPSGAVQGFVGCSERQALPSTFNFVSQREPFFVNGYGPMREYVVSLPGDAEGGYMTADQRNAEAVFNFTNGEDVQPDIYGDFVIVNEWNGMVLGGENGSLGNGSPIVANPYTGSPDQIWSVTDVPEDQGGDFSYSFIRNVSNGQAMDDNNWNLEEGGIVIAYGASGNAVQQWTFEYDGNGWFHIRNKQSALYLELTSDAAGTKVVQNSRNDLPGQRWRFIPDGAPVDFTAPSAPSALAAQYRSSSIALDWSPASGKSDVTYTVLRAEGSGRWITIARGIAEPSFLDNCVTEETLYRYKVMAEDASGNRSAASEEVTAGLAGGKSCIARFPFDNSLESVGNNGFSVRIPNNPVYVSGHRDGVSALNFRRTQFAQLPYDILRHPEFSVTFWMTSTRLSEKVRIFSTGIGSEETLYLLPDQQGAMKLVGINGDRRGEIAGPELVSGEWTHVAIVSDGHTARFYVNGKDYTSADASELAGCIPASRLLTYFGRGHEDEYDLYAGNISDLRVYNYAVTPAEVAEIKDSDGSGLTATYSDAEVVAVEYYTPQGVRMTAPAERGVTLTVTVWSDGRTRVTKQLR